MLSKQNLPKTKYARETIFKIKPIFILAVLPGSVTS